MPRLPVLLPADADAPFPPLAVALPSGLLAIGGDLSVVRLRRAYAEGIFPWFGEEDPILWWSPDPRCVFATATTRPRRRFARRLRSLPWTLSCDRAFAAVLAGCAAPRPGQDGTWITAAMRTAYQALHSAGYAHSFEVWEHGTLIGGLYGVVSGGLFSGESMFSLRSGASTMALLGACHALAQWRMPLLDAQVANTHTLALGAQQWSRTRFIAALHALRAVQPPPDWDRALPLRSAAQIAGV